MCGLVGQGEGGTFLDPDTGRLTTARGRFLRNLFDRLKGRLEPEETGPPAPSLTDPLAPMPDTLLRPNRDLVSEVGLNPSVVRRQRRQRTLGISQLGVPLPGRLSGGLNIPD